MAIVFDAQLVPGKLELLQAWVPQQPWLGGVDASNLTELGSYRFDDPDGEVGIETHLLGTSDGQVLQVPLTYRSAPRAGAEDSLITTMEHSVLGDRWIYDACSDPVYVTALATAILTGGREVNLFLSTDSGLVGQPRDAHVQGNGAPDAEVPDLGVLEVAHDATTTRMTGAIALTLFRIPTAVTDGSTLTGSWSGQEEPQLLAAID